ncbi:MULTISPECIES: chemotaxis protein CheC [Pseudomonas]|jgi:chemotaxis protein CheC|uniref:Chemotaxis protein CheC n=3 Tax=Gammaproteobacteria TaxID=1236 RepID=A0ABY1T4R9_PSEFL|nr:MULTISPECIES: chemotaxis protein CheC [Pseudomonas]MEA3169114.1 chemotaxis protein CheC [Pseudomonas sp.]MBC8783529.1 chemotaxis protein CheC [Pseudomonas fluorescens]MBK5548111.1 chemotaxis protein CheC [Pseudomonas sp. TH04]MCI4601912.1 chemotaxis protein CheC [Pseudomonas fluorescens]NNB67478.1 chemotaxis protein CheC [Pseudomonas fluorescens]
METLAELTEDQRDALQELMNIAMGQAAERLALLTNTIVTLSVPFIHPLIREQNKLAIPDHLRRSFMIVTRQSFLGELRGEVFVCFGAMGADKLAELLGYKGSGLAQQDELMLDVTNILTGACISGLAKQVATQVSYDAPSILVHSEEAANALDELNLNEHLAMVLEIRFEVQAHQFSCDLLICITERTASVVVRAIDRLLDEL